MEVEVEIEMGIGIGVEDEVPRGKSELGWTIQERQDSPFPIPDLKE
jgi:hypothetical protein